MTAPPRERPPRAANSHRPGVSDGDFDSLIVQPAGHLTEQMLRRKAWAYSLIRKFAGRPPSYGSAAWLALEDGSPEKIAAVCIAAEAWACTGDTLEADLRREVEALSLAHKHAEDRDYQQDSAQHRRTWGHLRVVEPRDEVDARVAAARIPRPGDFRPRRGGDLDAV